MRSYFLNKVLIRAVHSEVLEWMARNTKLMNSGLIYSIDTQSWHYFYDDPLSGDPEEKELISSKNIKAGDKNIYTSNLVSEIRILEDNAVKGIKKRLSQEYDDSDDLSSSQKHRLDMVAINYVKLCGSC